MSSTYRVLCLSHDPATEAGEYGTAEAAEDAIAEGLSGHPNCHLMIGRYSYPLVELGCPASRNQPAKLRCVHRGTVWVDSDWLRLLAVAYRSSDVAVQEAARAARSLCLSQDLLGRLRLELGTER